MPSYYLSEDLARFPDMGKTQPKLWDLYLRWYTATMEKGALDERTKKLIAAAFELRQRDHEVVVLEADDVGHALMRWGNTRFFSPLGMNVPRGFRRVLGSRMPPDDVLLTGPEMVERVLAPVAASPALTGCVRAHHRVVAVGRAGMLRGDHAGHPLRGERPFQ